MQASLALGSRLVPGVGQGFVLTWPPPCSREGLLSPSILIFFHLFCCLRIQKRKREEPQCIKSNGGGKLSVRLSSWKGLLGFHNAILFQNSIQNIYSSDLEKGEERRELHLWSSVPKPDRSLNQGFLLCIHCLI